MIIMKDESFFDLALIIPVYNEEGIIEKVINSWTAELKSLGIHFQIHVYNDGSKDGTLKILNTVKENNSNLIVYDKKNSGHGPTILQGYRKACGLAEWIFQVDSDNEMEAEWFQYLWKQRDSYDFILGRRHGRKSPVSRILVSYCSRMVVNLLYGSAIRDVNSPYRLMKATVFHPCFFSIPENTFAPNVIISGYAGLKKLKSFEINIPHKNRTTGTVSIQKMKLLKATIKSLMQTVLYRFSTDLSASWGR